MRGKLWKIPKLHHENIFQSFQQRYFERFQIFLKDKFENSPDFERETLKKYKIACQFQRKIFKFKIVDNSDAGDLNKLSSDVFKKVYNLFGGIFNSDFFQTVR